MQKHSFIMRELFITKCVHIEGDWHTASKSDPLKAATPSTDGSLSEMTTHPIMNDD